MKEKTRVAVWIVGIIIAIIGFGYFEQYALYIRDTIERNCNDRGGSYIGGHCILSKEVQEYEWCLYEKKKQEGRIAVLPMKCAKWVEKLYLNQ